LDAFFVPHKENRHIIGIDVITAKNRIPVEIIKRLKGIAEAIFKGNVKNLLEGFFPD